MSGPGDPLDKLTRLWTRGLASWAESLQHLAAVLPAAPVPCATEETQDLPAGDAFVRRAEAWMRALGELGEMQTRLLGRVADALPAEMQQRFDAETFRRLDRLARTDWNNQLERLPQVLPAMAERLGRADPERIGKLFESMMAEYLEDLDGLDEDAFRLDVAPLAEAFERVLAGEADEQARAVVDRFLGALSVKARYGPAYYADPGQVPVGTTPRDCIHQDGTVKLYRYRPEREAAPAAPPVLLVYSIINRPFILDLIPSYSFVRHLLGRGLDVYLLDWGEPRPGDRTTLDELIEPQLEDCVGAVRTHSGARRVSLFGHCIGGNLALMYTALHPQDVDRLITPTTPATGARGGVVGVWTDRDVFPVEEIVEIFGVMPAKLIRTTFLALKPYFEVVKWKKFIDNLGDDQVMRLFYAIDRWANQNVDVPGAVFCKFIEEVFHEDRFRRGQTTIHGRPVDLAAVTCPYLNLAATRDWIVPVDSARILGDLVGSADKRFVPIEGAHVSVMIDPKLAGVWEQMSGFLLSR